MMNGKPCCGSCADGNGCEGKAPMVVSDYADADRIAGGFNQPTAASASGQVMTLIDAAIDCRTKEYDPKVEKSFKLV
jgi:hypothetical protein